MPGSAPFQLQLKRRGQLLLVLIGVVSILIMPVDYRAGAASTHPHATAQLLIDLSDGSLEHHGGSSPLGHWPGQHPRRSVINRGVRPVLTPGPAHSWITPVSRPMIVAMDSQTTSRASTALAADQPSFSPRSDTAAKISLAAALLPAIAALLWPQPGSRFHWPRQFAWRGREHGPEPPPPRHA